MIKVKQPKKMIKVKQPKMGIVAVMEALLLVILVATFPMPVSADSGEPTVKIESTSADVGSTTTTTITAYNVSNFSNYGLYVHFNSTIVNITNATFNPAMGTASFESNVIEGYIRIYTLNLGPPFGSFPDQSGDMLLATFELETIGTIRQTSQLDVEIRKMVYTNKSEFTAATVNGTFTIGGAAAPTLTWTTEPPTPVTHGDGVAFDVSFSEAADYYFRIENSANEVVWRYPTSGTGHAANPGARTWTTTADTPTGDYTIIVNINGADNSDMRTVTVGAAANQPPTAVITSPTATGTYRVGDEVSFLSTGSEDPDGTIVSYNWTFGDGNTSEVANTTHTYATANAYTVMLTVTDNDGATDTTTVTINVHETGAVSVSLYTGWNLIAVPVNDASADTAAELASKITGCKEVVKWDATTQMYVEYTKISGDWTGIDFDITGGMGLFVNVDGSTTVGFTGDKWS
ncbi:MAG: PKD domain protein [Candidatus Argoarchaeum ethanivorans]|uniref:PKD domain protein n=1 Tax=Candidatus Argoarchaeum ethanivorans TaxID=2608793 RepID=A0A811T6I9_9EURY|nr:MAG: PKD domain protein [Candidatus Argoarchaeum ethanivorans]